MSVAAYADVGRAAKEVLLGIKDPAYQFDQKVALSTKTADGVSLTFIGAKKGENMDLQAKAAYAVGKYGFTAMFNTTDKISIAASAAELAPGLRATLAATLPDASSGKLTLDYANPYTALRAVVGLTSTPKAQLYATTAYKKVLLGAEVGYDTAKSTVSSYGLAASWTAADSQFAVVLEDKLETARLLASHAVSKSLTIGTELTRPVAGGDVSFALGATRRLDNGGLVKGKLDDKGLLSALYSQRLTSGERITLSAQLDTINPGAKAPKIGVALDLA